MFANAGSVISRALKISLKFFALLISRNTLPTLNERITDAVDPKFTLEVNVRIVLPIDKITIMKSKIFQPSSK